MVVAVGVDMQPCVDKDVVWNVVLDVAWNVVLDVAWNVVDVEDFVGYVWSLAG